MRFEVLMAVTMNSTVFWNVTLYSLAEVYRHFTASIFRVGRPSRANKQQAVIREFVSHI
jgi:hypothetical protein